MFKDHVHTIFIRGKIIFIIKKNILFEIARLRMMQYIKGGIKIQISHAGYISCKILL